MATSFCLVYFSRATQAFTPLQLQELAKTSQHYNNQCGITGMLLSNDGCFFQLLEGEETAVRQLYAKIENDPRHTQVQLLFADTIDRKFCPVWDMLLLVGPDKMPDETMKKINELTLMSASRYEHKEQLVSDLFCCFMTPTQLREFAQSR